MFHRIPAFILLTILCASGMRAFGEADTDRIDSRAYDPSAAAHTLLVTFQDRGINRVSVGPRSSQYASRGSYKSTAWANRIATRIAADYNLELVAQWPVTELGVHCVVYYVPADQVIEESENALSLDHRVELVQRMGVFKTLGTTGADPYYPLQQNMQALHIEQLHQRSTGQGIRIAIIDTGIDLGHPDLDGQFLGNSNFVSDISPSFETDRHGTAVAGIIGAKAGNGAGIVGIATDAKMYAYKACWQTTQDGMDAVCNSFTLALAINSAIRKNAQIINLSLTGPADPLLEALLNRAIERGIIVVAADDSTPETAPGFPASMPQVIAVRNSTSDSHGSESRSNVITMPGTEILTTIPPDAYDFLSGSSFSAASVSGLAALALQLQPALTSAEIIASLQHNGADFSSTFLTELDHL
ncbi:MAG: S8 family serine peptidase [Gammaproteobacteria bacterium]